MINDEQLSLAHVHTFNMDEYASEDGVTAPASWPGSFQRAMLERFFAHRPRAAPAREPDPLPDHETHSPTTRADRGPRRRRRLLRGIGWCGHIAFWEPHLGEEFDGDLEAYKRAGPASWSSTR